MNKRVLLARRRPASTARRSWLRPLPHQLHRRHYRYLRYDAFGSVIASTGSTPNNYRFAGEQFDPLLGIYYNRARYYDQRQGRFWSMDTWEEIRESVEGLHRYLYTAANPVNLLDRSGNDFDLGSVAATLGSIGTLATTALVTFQNVASSIYFNLYRVPDLLDTVGLGLLTLHVGTQAVIGSAEIIDQLASNVQNAPNTPYSPGAIMGFEFRK